MNAQIKKLIVVVLMIAGGILFIVFGARSVKEMRDFIEVPAVVARVDRELQPDADGGMTEDVTIYVTYTVDGKEYTEQLQNTKTNLKENESITVRYNPEDPTQVSGATKGIATFQFIGGGVLILAGLVTGFMTLIRRR